MASLFNSRPVAPRIRDPSDGSVVPETKCSWATLNFLVADPPHGESLALQENELPVTQSISLFLMDMGSCEKLFY